MEAAQTVPALRGLETDEVAAAIRRGEVNTVDNRTSRPISTIIRSNIFTLFNAILTAALVVVLIVGDWKDAVFGMVMIINALIGIVSETRAKRTLDRLSILQAPHSVVVRSGEQSQIPAHEVVLGDTIYLTLGDQIPADGEVLSAAGLRVDESMLTGESVPVRKHEGDHLLSGTAVVAGSGYMRASAVGANAYAQQLTTQAKRFKQARSEIADGINLVLRWISWVIVPVVVILVWSQLRADEGSTWQHAVVLAIAGVVGMIPQGLVLLTSLNFALAAATLARRNVLIQELNAVEVLARVDRLCLDKTGTLTSGAITFRGLIPVSSQARNERKVEARLGELVATPEVIATPCLGALAALVADRTNETAKATADALKRIPACQSMVKLPFDSARKWAALSNDTGVWYFGAPEIVAANASNAEVALEAAQRQAQDGARVVCLAHSPSASLNEDDPQLPADIEASLLVVLEEEIRSDAAQTMEYFQRQGVVAKVISGDNPATVATIARRVGLAPVNGERITWRDARELPEDSNELRQVIRTTDVFGRVTPEVKRAMVQALQADGHTVAMTGDGVNDVLALKDADLGIAMGSGATATKAVAKVVLVDGKFSKLPSVVSEGRRIIANMERVGALFLTKTFYSSLLAVIVALAMWRYPFLPRHLTIIGSLTIGIPAFFLALAPNHRRYRAGFLSRTLWLAAPAGMILALASLLTHRLTIANPTIASTAASLTIIGGGIYLLSILSRPLVPWRLALLTTMASLALLVVFLAPLRHFFALAWPDTRSWLVIGVISVLSWTLLELLYRYHQHRFGAVTRLVSTSEADRQERARLNS